jgi:hypothetical protein
VAFKIFWSLRGFETQGNRLGEALREITHRCGRIEASFASKLVATLDPSKPIIDKFVLEYFAMRLPRWGAADRADKTIELYRELCEKYQALLQSPTGQQIRESFDLRYPKSEITQLKKIDLVLWQLRA